MIKSQFIKNILALLIEGTKEEELLRKQIDLLTDSEYEYTGAGLFVSFSHDDAISQFKSEIGRVLEGAEVRIQSSQLEMDAGTVLFFDGGVIDCLEVFTYDGKYPNSELKDYHLSQAWLPDGGKKIKVP